MAKEKLRKLENIYYRKNIVQQQNGKGFDENKGALDASSINSNIDEGKRPQSTFGGLENSHQEEE